MLSITKSHSEDGRRRVLWEELGAGAPTLIAFAQLCSEAMVANRCEPVDSLSAEARGILYAARKRGVLEIKGTNHAFEASERFLAICVDIDGEQQLVLRRREDPELTIRFLEGFRQLCNAGLVMHHLFRDFSLTGAGFDVARGLTPDETRVLEVLIREQDVSGL